MQHFNNVDWQGMYDDRKKSRLSIRRYYEAGRYKAFCPEGIDPAFSTIVHRLTKVGKNQVPITVLTSLNRTRKSEANPQTSKAAGTHLVIKLANGAQIEFECTNPEQFALQALSLKTHRAQGGFR